MDNNKEINWAAAAFGIAVTFIITIFYTGYIFSVLWGWFIVPLGAPQIDHLQSAGLIVIGMFLKNTKVDKESLDWKFVVRSIIMEIIWPATILHFGFLVHLMM